jgi:hypothetical protein
MAYYKLEPDGRGGYVHRKMGTSEQMADNLTQAQGPMKAVWGVLVAIPLVWLLFLLGLLVWFIVLVAQA